METEDDALGSAGEVHVRLGDGADGVVDDIESDLVGLDLPERLDDGFDGTLCVRLDDDLEGELLVLRNLGEEVFQRDARTAVLGIGGLLCQLALLRDVAGRAFVIDDNELDAGLGHAVEAEHAHGDGRGGDLEAFALFIDEGADASVVGAAEDDVADLEGALADEDGGGGATGLESGLDDVALGLAVRVGLELQQVGLEDNHLQQLVDALLCHCGTVHEECGAAPFVGREALFLKLLADAGGVRVRVVALVDGDEDRDFRGQRV